MAVFGVYLGGGDGFACARRHACRHIIAFLKAAAGEHNLAKGRAHACHFMHRDTANPAGAYH